MKSPLLKSVKCFLVHYLGGLYHRADEHHIFLLGGGLAFSLFVCIVPFILILFSVLGSILQSSSLQTQVNGAIEKIIPYEGYSSFIKNFVYTRIEEFKTYKNIAGYIGAIGLLIAASGLFSSMRTILNRVFIVGMGKRFVIAKLRDLGMVLLVLAFFLISTAILPAFDILKDLAQKTELLEIFRFGRIANISILGVSYFLIFLVFFILYYLIPQGRLGTKVPAVSAFWAAFLWEVARQMFGYYITHIASLKQIYGTYVLMVVVAFWIYYSSIIFILGAEIGQLYRERHQAAGEY